jgi:hypothetical protein
MITLALRSRLEPAHRSQPRLQPAVVAFDLVVGVAVGLMPRRRQQLVEYDRVGRCSVGNNLDRHDLRRADRPFEEPAGSPGVTLGGDKDIDDLSELVDRPVHVAPPISSGR